MAVKVGDSVRFLNATGGGVVKKIDGGIAHVEDAEGFVTPVMVKEIVVIEPHVPKASPVAETISQSFSWGKEETQPVVDPELPPYEETPEGEKINAVIAFIPNDIKKLGDTQWELYLVNDSNFWLSFVLMSRSTDSKQWTLRNVNVIEPGTQLFLEDITATDLQELDRIKFQCVAFKKEKSFDAKNVFNVEEKLDTTKFFKLHCYKPGEYFDEDCITIELIKNDVAAHEKKRSETIKLEEALQAKKMLDLKPVVRRIKKRPIENDPLAPLVVDLHIEELVDNTRGMSAADILNRQVDEFREVMDAHSRHKGKKIVFIHGKGEGVLRNALLKELNHRYKGNDVQDASFQEYGFGATQVVIK